MHAYLATIGRDLGAEFVRIGGVADHVHIVTTLPRTLSQADLIERIKKASSKWIKTLDARYRGFFWQRGYGAFSVSPSQLEAVLEYIRRNKSTIALARFRKNIASCYTGTPLISMSDMCGIENQALGLSRAFSACWWCNRIPGAMPQAKADIPPLALNTYVGFRYSVPHVSSSDVSS